MLWRETRFALHVQLQLSAVNSTIQPERQPFSPKHTLLSQLTSKNRGKCVTTDDNFTINSAISMASSDQPLRSFALALKSTAFVRLS